jgi:hypothetical protein
MSSGNYYSIKEVHELLEAVYKMFSLRGLQAVPDIQ